MLERICPRCGQPFTAKTPLKRFCRRACNAAYLYAQNLAQARAKRRARANNKASQERMKRWIAANPERRRETSAARYASNLPYVLWSAARRRAMRNGVPFDIEPSDIEVPTLCPILGLRLAASRGMRADTSPSLDRINPALGYTKSNIAVISWRANRLKQDASLSELINLTTWLASHHSK